jgi:hypothetical protein
VKVFDLGGSHALKHPADNVRGSAVPAVRFLGSLLLLIIAGTKGGNAQEKGKIQ